MLLGHPGGSIYLNRDEGAWSIPKGEVKRGEDLLHAARREFEEETGISPKGPFTALTPVLQRSGKLIYAWGLEGDCDPRAIVSNTFTMQWPPRSGRQMAFPEIDRAEFFDLETARLKINGGQRPLIDELEGRLDAEPSG